MMAADDGSAEAVNDASDPTSGTTAMSGSAVTSGGVVASANRDCEPVIERLMMVASRQEVATLDVMRRKSFIPPLGRIRGSLSGGGYSGGDARRARDDVRR